MNTLLQEAILATHCFSQAIIVRRKDHLVKAKTKGCTLTSQDFFRLHELFEHPIATREQGFTVANVPYKAIRVDANSIYGKLDEDALLLLQIQKAADAAATENGRSTDDRHGDDDGDNSDDDQADNNNNADGGDAAAAAKKKTHKTRKHAHGADDSGGRAKHEVEVLRPHTSAVVQGKQFDGIIVCKTVLFLIIGIYDHHPALAVECMERLAEYFRSKNR
ncbi:Profilin-4 [Sorochytrium milnesiophthora]